MLDKTNKNNFLTSEDKALLLAELKKEHDKRSADRLRIILLLDSGWAYKDIAKAYFLDDSTLRNYRSRWNRGGIEALVEDNYKPIPHKLSVEDLDDLKANIENKNFITAQEFVEYIKDNYGVEYSISGATRLLKELGYSYKKPKIIPCKIDLEAQEKFKAEYKVMKSSLGEHDKIYYSDACHPQLNGVPSYGWFPKNKRSYLKTLSGRKRININGALDIKTNELIVLEEKDNVNADSALRLIKEIEKRNPLADKIYVIVDNARYNYNKKVREYLETSKVEFKYLPSYSPNLNIIERVWKFMKKHVFNNKFYNNHEILRETALNFLNNIKIYDNELKTLLTDNFESFDTS